MLYDILYSRFYRLKLMYGILLPEHRKEVLDMCDNNQNEETKEIDLNNKRKSSCILLRDIAVDLEDQLYSIKMQIKSQSSLLQEKKMEMSERERTKAHNLDLFSPIYSKACDTSEIKPFISQIDQEIIDLNQKKMELENKISGLRAAAECIESSMQMDAESSIELDKDDNKQKGTVKGLGILEAQEVERQRIARDLHDTTVQNLTSLVHKSELCIKLIDIDTIRAKLELNTMSNTLKMVINDMRGIIYNLKPMTLDDLGLTITVQRFANKLMNLHNIQVRVIANEETKEILPVIKLTIFRIIQEACNNVLKHANASLINIEIKYEENSINVNIKDDGIGFSINSNTSEQPQSFGLSIMKERISLLSGTLDINSEKGKGTIVTIFVPLTTCEGDKNEQTN